MVGQKAFKPDDFMPKFGPPRDQSMEEQKAAAQAIALAFGGTVSRGG